MQLLRSHVTTILSTVLFFFVFFPQSVSAQTVEDTWTTDGYVYTLENGPSNTLYVGGYFQYIGPFTGAHVPVNTTTGERSSTFPKVTSDNSSDPIVYAAISDGSGGWYIGGNFDRVGGHARDNLAHILSDGTVDPDFNPGTSGTVYTLLLDGSWLYVGGNFGTIDSESHENLARVNATTGDADSSWTPNTSSAANDDVEALALTGTTLYVGGQFSTLAGVSRAHFGAVSTLTGAATSFNPGPNCCVDELLLNGTTLYVGGNFTQMLATSRRGLVAIDTTSNTLTSWNPNGGVGFDADVLALSGSTIYAGGSFNTTVGGASRVDLVALDTSTGNATSFNANIDSSYTNGVSAVTVDGSTVYFGGRFKTVDGNRRNNIAAVNATTGALTSWNASAGTWDNHQVFDIDVSGSTVRISGQLISINGEIRNSVAQIDKSTGELTSWDPDCPFCSIYAIAYNDSSVFIGGDIATINEYDASRRNLAEVDITTGLATSFTPAPNNAGYIHMLELSGDTLFVGGRFTTIGGQARNRLASFDISTDTITSWNPDANGNVLESELADGVLYVGGAFTAIGASTRNYVAAFNTSNGSLTSWDPNSNGSVYDLKIDSGSMFVTGNFSSIGGASRAYLAELSLTDGQATSWSTNINSYAEEMSIDGENIYVAGGFDQIGGEERIYAGVIEKSTGSVKDWDVPYSYEGYLYAVTHDENLVYFGGNDLLQNSSYDLHSMYAATKASGGSSPSSSPGSSSSSSSSSGSSGSTNSYCSLAKPGTPNLYQVVWNRTSATLYFTPVGGNPQYVISYGKTPSADTYAVNINPGQPNGAVRYTVSRLENGVRYYFKIYALNECQPGDWSSVLSTTGARSGRVRVTPTPRVQTRISNVKVNVGRRNTAVITWTTNEPAVSYFEWGEDKKLEKSQYLSRKTRTHRVTLSNLDPQKVYYFRIASQGTTRAVYSTHSFRLAGPTPTQTGVPSIPVSTDSAELATSSGILTPITAAVGGVVSAMTESVAGVHTAITDTATDTVSAIMPGESEKVLLQGIQEVRNAPVVKTAVSSAQTVSVITASAVFIPKTGFDLFTSLSVLKDIPLYLTRFIFFVLELFGLRKRVKQWGVVFDASNGRPIDPAIVTLFKRDGETESQIGQRITDMAGRFGFLVQNGTYFMTVKKTDYAFPSKLLNGKREYRDYKNLYFGNDLKFTENDIVTVNIPMDPVRANWNQEVKDQYYKPYKQVLKESFVMKLMVWAVFLNLALYLFAPNPSNLLLLAVSIGLLVLRKFVIRKKSWGVVFDKKTRKVFSDVAVRAVKVIEGKELAAGSATTDAAGRYYMILSEGKQFLQVEKIENGVTTILKKTAPFTVTRTTVAVNPDIAL